MNVEKVLVDLREYKARLDECIGVLDRLARQRKEKRGRPIIIPAASRRGAATGRRKRKVATG
jgi:hypothetical protein